MKRFFPVFLAAVLLISCAAADPVDLSVMSFDELVQLRDQLNLAIWNSQEWQEVTVPAGVWIVGQDIPAGHWTVRPLPGDYVNVTYFDRLDKYGKSVGLGWRGWGGTLTARGEGDITFGEPTQVDLEMEEGMFFKCNHSVIFTPYAGKPDLGFK